MVRLEVVRRVDSNEDFVQRVFYREGLLQFYCKASLTISGWGLHVQIEPEIDREPFTVAGAWEILSITQNRVAALYVDWSITVPERKNEMILSCTLKLPIQVIEKCLTQTDIFVPLMVN